MKDQSFFERLNNWIRNSITIKLISIGILILIMLIPTSMIESLIWERQTTMDNAISEVSSKWGNAQTITGPVLSVPYISYQKDEKGVVVEILNYAHFLPDKLDINGKLNPEMRYRGIYEVVVYNTKLTFKGKFSSPNLKDWNIAENLIIWKDAFVSIGVPDMRGIENKVDLKWNDKQFALNPGIDSKDIMESGISVKIPVSTGDTSKGYNFSFDISLNGSGDLDFIPLGKETNVHLESNWSTPSFDGAFLPDQREISSKGFKATWNILHLNRNYPQQWRNAEYKVGDSYFGVKLLVPVDEYQKTTRSAKYAVMVIALTFLLFFFSEVLNKKRIHPVQYLLVGIALCIFYTLLLSLSEHISFNLAYIVSSIAVIGLITFYSLSIFKDKKMSGLMCLILVILYAFVFTILQLEDYALLMGSIGLFIVLAVIMQLSRKINWYSGNSEGENKNI
jgi:inner membrane protein